MSEGYAARSNLDLVLLSLSDTWFDSKLRDGIPNILLGGTSLRGNLGFGPVG